MSSVGNLKSVQRPWLDRTSPGKQLRDRLSELRRMRLFVGSISGLFKGGLAFIATLLAWVWMDLVLDLSSSLRATGWVAAFSMMLFCVWRIYRGTAKASREDQLAQQLDDAAGTGGQIRSGLDLAAGDRSGHSPTQQSLSAELAEMAVKKATMLAHSVPENDVAPMDPALKAAFAAIGAVVALIIAGLIAPRMALTELKRFFNPWGDVPAYSQYTFDINTAGDTVLYGGDFEISANVSGPNVEQLQLVLIPPAPERKEKAEDAEPIDVLPMFPDPSGKWHATVAAITEDFDFFLKLRRARSETKSVNVITVPSIEDVQVEVAAPLYTGISVYRGNVPSNGIEGLPGTEVTLKIRSNRPLSGGRLNYITESDQEVELQLTEDPQVVAGSFEITEEGRVEFEVIDEDGQASTEFRTIPIHRLTDQSPLVRMTQPKAVSFATPSAIVPVAVAAEDDYGLRRCQLFRSLNHSRFLPTDLELPTGLTRMAQVGTVLPLAKYKLQPGDEIRLFARVEDNDPNGPNAPIGKGAESRIVSLRIISQEDFDRVQVQKAGLKTMMNRYQQAQRRLESLADKMQQLHDKLKEAPEGSELAKELREEMQQLAKDMQKEAEAIRKLGEKPLPLELDQQLSPELKKMAERLQEMSQQMQETASKPGTTSKEALEQMQQQLDAMKKEQGRHRKEAMEPMEHLARVLPLKQAESEFVQLVQRQRQLADRLQSLREASPDSNSETRARVRELEEEQHRVREQLADLLDRIEENANNLPDAPELEELKQTAQEFAKAVRSCGAQGEMANAEGALTDFDGKQGHSHADRAAELLEQLVGQCNGMGGACKNCLPKFSPSLGQCLSNTLEQLAPGFKPGSGRGGVGMGMAGEGGNSSQMSTANNVGMYGGDPMFDPANTTMGESESDNVGGMFTDPLASGQGTGEGGFNTQQTNPAFGGGNWGVPIQYRRQAGRYLQQLAEELDE